MLTVSSWLPALFCLGGTTGWTVRIVRTLGTGGGGGDVSSMLPPSTPLRRGTGGGGGVSSALPPLTPLCRGTGGGGDVSSILPPLTPLRGGVRESTAPDLERALG